MPETKPHAMSSLCSELPGHAFTELFRAHFRYVYVQLRRLGVPAAAVDDAVQEVFIVVLRRHAEAPVVYVRGWLFAILRRIAHRHRRGAQRQHRLQNALACEPAATPDAHAAVIHRQGSHILAAFLDRLADDRREVFILAELEQMTAREIARTLGIKENTVSSRLRAARQEFDRNFARVRLRERRLTGEAATDERALLLSHARRADDPSPAARQRAWIVLLAHPDLGGLGLAREAPLAAAAALTDGAGGLAEATAAHVPAQLVGSGVAGKLTAWAVALGVGGLLVLSASQARSPATAGPDASAPAAGSGRAIAARSDRPVVPARTHTQAPLAASVVASPAREVGPRRVRDTRPSTASDQLQREATLMARARAAIRRGDSGAAQELLARHAREFPAGALVDERELSTISVLCVLGQGDAARRVAASLAAARPDSALAQRAGDLCRENSSTEIRPAGD